MRCEYKVTTNAKFERSIADLVMVGEPFLGHRFPALEANNPRNAFLVHHSQMTRVQRFGGKRFAAVFA